MPAKRITLSDGTKLTTASGCRFTLFAISDDSRAHIVKRSDNADTIDREAARAAKRYLRVVVVDWHPFTPRYEDQRPPCVRTDSDAWLPRQF